VWLLRILLVGLENFVLNLFFPGDDSDKAFLDAVPG